MEERKQQELDAESMGEIIAADDVGIREQEHEEHHHYHHRHHRGHSRRKHHHHKHKPSKKKNKFAAFIKKHRGALINILSCTVSVVLLIVLAVSIDFSRPESKEVNHTDITQSTVQIETSVYHEKALLVSDAISYYVQQKDSKVSANEVYKLFNGHKRDLNLGLPLSFTYRVTGLPGGIDAQSAMLEVSENADFSEAMTYKLDLDGTGSSLYNLKTGTKYYYRVTLMLTNGGDIATTGSFETEASPRILNIDGAVNVRDIGGWSTKDGRTIKQGLLYRGSKIDGAVEPEYKITDLGLQQMIAGLGIRFDMDLRSSHENENGTDALGKNVAHKYYGVGMYSELLKDKEKLKAVFSDLANPDNYPIYLHCTYGRDRTGSVCYLLEALLGMSEEDLHKEYELSAFTDSYVNTAEFNAFVELISSFEGETTQEKVEGYLLSIGGTAEEIATIRQIFLKEE